MAVSKPDKVLGRSIALKSAQKQMQTRASRAAFATLNLTAMVDMFTLLVVFLLANFSATGEVLFITKDIVLPKAVATAELFRAPVISISGQAVSLEGKHVIATDEAARDDVSTLVDLTYMLQETRRVDEQMHPGALFKGTIILHCDEGIAFSIVRKVMYAAAEAGYVDFNYAVMVKKPPTAAEPAEGG